MAGTAGFRKVLRISSDDPAGAGFLATSWKQVPSKDASLSNGADNLDDTNMQDNAAGWRSFVLGLLQWSINGNLIGKPGSADIAQVRDSMINRTQLWMQYLPNGIANLSQGYQGEVLVSTFDDSGSVEDLEMVSFTLQGTGSLETAT